MPSANLLRKRAKLEIPRNGFQNKDRAGYTKNHSVPRRYRLPKRSAIRRYHKR